VGYEKCNGEVRDGDWMEGFGERYFAGCMKVRVVLLINSFIVLVITYCLASRPIIHPLSPGSYAFIHQEPKSIHLQSVSCERKDANLLRSKSMRP
jgi:hypothetical protein